MQCWLHWGTKISMLQDTCKIYADWFMIEWSWIAGVKRQKQLINTEKWWGVYLHHRKLDTGLLQCTVLFIPIIIIWSQGSVYFSRVLEGYNLGYLTISLILSKWCSYIKVSKYLLVKVYIYTYIYKYMHIYIYIYIYMS